MREHAVVFGNESPLVGIVTEPDSRLNGAPVCVLLNAGLGHRVGPNRLNVSLARKLADVGLTSLRFDFSGIGDSPASPSLDDAEESGVNETMQAMDFLAESLGPSRFVPIGLCSGANVAFALARRDKRVVGAVLINAATVPSAHSDDQMKEARTRAEAHHHEARLADWKSWLRVLTARSDLAAVTRSTLRLARRAAGLKEKPLREFDLGVLPELDRRGVELLVMYTEGDIGLELLASHVGPFENLASLERVRLEILRETDHILTPLWAQAQVEEMMLDWMTRRLGVGRAATRAESHAL
ncbi:MAG TPA: alpha/beta fold hydrolase [Vicinamibacterales bacterium]|nr:alpha/beta fold hydrolase [Vicinamibacterales bacterium]